jgi:hypothetical protein
MKAIAALVIAGISAAIAGCGSESMHVTHPATASPLKLRPAQAFAESIAGWVALPGASDRLVAPMRYRTFEYSAVIANLGTPDSFTAFVLVSRTITIQPSSAASIDTFADGPPTFTTPMDRARWKAAGSPSLTSAPRGGQMLSLPTGQFSFIPQGRTLTYQQARLFPGTPQGVSAQLMSHLRAFAGPRPPTTLVLRQLGYLIAAAPLNAAARAAAWRVVAALPGLRLCGNGTDLAGRSGQGLCEDFSGEETEILIDTSTGSVLAVEEWLLRPSRMYPMVPSGGMVSSTTFLSQRDPASPPPAWCCPARSPKGGPAAAGTPAPAAPTPSARTTSPGVLRIFAGK